MGRPPLTLPNRNVPKSHQAFRLQNLAQRDVPRDEFKNDLSRSDTTITASFKSTMVRISTLTVRPLKR